MEVGSVSRVVGGFILVQHLALLVGAVVRQRVGQECIESGSGEGQSVSWVGVLG